MSLVSTIKFCDYYSNTTAFCGLVAVQGDRCKAHAGKESQDKKSKSVRFRGDSQWQVEQGMGKSKEGSNV